MLDFFTVVTNHANGTDTIASHRNGDAARQEAKAECSYGALFSYVYDGDGVLVVRHVGNAITH